jgi:hypothetical protein
VNVESKEHRFSLEATQDLVVHKELQLLRQLLRSSTMVQSRHFSEPTGFTLNEKWCKSVINGNPGLSAKAILSLVIWHIVAEESALDGRCPNDARQH